MKKILGLLIVLGSFIFLASCKNDTVDLKALLNEIEITYQEGSNALNVLDDLTLPLTVGGIDIEWKSDSDNLKVDDNKALVTRVNEDLNVSLTAFINYQKQKDFKIFYLTLKKLDKYYTVSFYSDDSYNKLIEEVEVLENTKVSEIELEPKEGYDFNGWFLNALKFDFDTLINNDIKLYANYSKQLIHTVHVKYNDDLDNDEDFFILDGNKLPELKTPTKEGYKFRGYYNYLTDKLFDFDTVIKSDIELYALFILDVSYKVTVEYEDNTKAEFVVPNGDLLAPLEDLTKEGYIFLGYYDRLTDMKFDFSTEIDGDLTLYPKFEKIVLNEKIIKEDFELLGPIKGSGGNFSSYEEFFYHGEYTWDIINGRIDLGMKAGGNAITLGGFGNDLGDAGLGRIESEELTGGISYLEFDARLPFSPESSYPQRNGKDTANNVNISIMINGEKVHNFKFKDNKTANKGEKFILENINVSGNYKVSIDVSSGHRLTVDNILIKSNLNGEEPEIPETELKNLIDFENTGFDFMREETIITFGDHDFKLKEVHTLNMHREKELDFMDKDIHGNKVARFRGAPNHWASTDVAYMESVSKYNLTEITFDARLFGDEKYSTSNSLINIYIENNNEWEIIESINPKLLFENYKVTINKENVRFKIEVLYGSINIDNIKF